LPFGKTSKVKADVTAEGEIESAGAGKAITLTLMMKLKFLGVM
jgi:sulfate adenylyltransferase subunit 1 (EFTu-like GTPase family)